MAGRGRRPDPAMRKRAFRLLEQGRTQGEVRRITGLSKRTVQRYAAETKAGKPPSDAK